MPEAAKAAPELMRSLLYVAVPEWACEQKRPDDPHHPDRRQLGTLVATLAAAPIVAADTLFEHMFTDNVDTSQRLLALDTFGAAAAELAGAPTLLALAADGAVFATDDSAVAGVTCLGTL